MRGVDAPLSDALLATMRENLVRGDQSILFLNRRGYAPALQCTACGEVPECPGCSIRLTLHRRAGQLRCHTCGFRRRVPKTCESCGEHALMPLGEGMEKLEEWLTEQMPELRFERFDRDVITSHARLANTLAAFEAGELDCLIGTQMLVKGHDFPNVTLVGVVNADLGVNLPDFRAGERWWQQMTQVTGRAGRGEKPGRVMIQTRMPEAGWLSRISEDEATRTLDDELKLREMLHYPPYARWVRLVFSSGKVERATEVATQFARHCAKLDGINVTGPMPCPMERIAGKYRIEILLRDTSRKLLPWKLAARCAHPRRCRPARHDVITPDYRCFWPKTAC
jgi:primosomal protein N' (replication factor Y)